MIREVLLSVPSYPDATPEGALESAVTLSRLLGARLTANLRQLNGDQSTWPFIVGTFPLDFPQKMHQLVLKSEASVAASTASLTRLCAEYGVALDLRRGLSTWHEEMAPLLILARLHDLIVLPVPESDAPGHSCVEAILFGSGRPTVLLPSNRKPLQWLDRIVLAWDWSREAARALYDSLPLLALAKEVHVLTVLGEKQIKVAAPRTDLERLLSIHHVRHHLAQIDSGGRPIGDVLLGYAEHVGADLLVMGAYGHSRVHEFILGGATREVLRDPLLPVLISR